MAREETIISDLSGLPVDDPIRISIRRKGHNIKIGKNYYSGDTVLDLDASELSGFLDSVSFEKKQLSKALMPSELSEDVKVTFFGVVGELPNEHEKVPVVRPWTAQKPLHTGEHP